MEFEPPEAIRDAAIATQCDASACKMVRAHAVEFLLQSPSKLTRNEIEHFLVFLEHQGLHSDHITQFLQLLRSAVEANPALFASMATEASVLLWMRLAENSNMDIQRCFGDLLREFKIHRHPVLGNPVKGLLVHIAEMALRDDVQQHSPVVEIVFKILHHRFDSYVFDMSSFVEGLSDALLHKLMQDPFDLQILNVAFLLLDKLVNELGRRLHSFYSLLTSIMIENQHNPKRQRVSVDFLCAGALACIAHAQPVFLDEVVHRLVPCLQILPYVLSPVEGITMSTALRIIHSIMSVLIYSSGTSDHLKECPVCNPLLWKLTDSTHWSLKDELRVILMESGGDPVRRRFALTRLTPNQLRKVLRYHGLSRSTAMRCNMSGNDLMQQNARYIDFMLRLSPKELKIVRDAIIVYTGMRTITGLPACECVTCDAMEQYLNYVPDQTIARIRRVRDPDGRYYFDDLMSIAEVIGEICNQLPNEN